MVAVPVFPRSSICAQALDEQAPEAAFHDLLEADTFRLLDQRGCWRARASVGSLTPRLLPVQVPETIQHELDQLVEDYRTRCLWFLRPDFRPRTGGEILSVLRHIETHGDRAAFLRVAAIRRWLSQHSSESSASS
jgi:hypothetical protein